MSQGRDGEGAANESIPIDVGKFGRIIDRACSNSSFTIAAGLKIIPNWVRDQTFLLMDSLWRSGFFTRGRRREIVVLAILKIVLGPDLSYEDLINRAQIVFEIQISQKSMQNVLEDIRVSRRYRKELRVRQVGLNAEDRRVMVILRRSSYGTV